MYPDKTNYSGTQTRSEIIEFARSWVGVPWRHQGRTRNGIDCAAVKRKAFEKLFLNEEQLETVEDAEVLDLLFQPGFSMAKKLTDVSGRGVGMDVIRSTMVELKGNAALQSSLGSGTTVSLRIPADYYQQL